MSVKLQGEYSEWISRVKYLLINNYLIKNDTTITEDFYLPYYQEGYTPQQSIKEDLGEDALKNRFYHMDKILQQNLKNQKNKGGIK